MRGRTFALISMILLLAACGGEPKDNRSWMEPAPSPTSTTMPPPATTPEVAAGTTVLITITEGHIATADGPIPPGPAVLTVANAGAEIHDLHVEGPNVKGALDAPIAMNGSGTMNVTFQRGSYELYCPILEHRTNGETLKIQID